MNSQWARFRIGKLCGCFLLPLFGCAPQPQNSKAPAIAEGSSGAALENRSIQKPHAPDQLNELKSSWSQFESRFKSRESQHEAEYIKRDSGKRCRIQWKRIDLERTNSVLNPIRGIVELKWFGSDTYNNSFEYDYRFEFIPVGNEWKFDTGRFIRIDKGRERITRTPETESVYTPPLQHKWKVLFEGE